MKNGNPIRILIASAVCPQAVARLQERHDVLVHTHGQAEVLRAVVRDREILVFRSGVKIDAQLLSCAAALKLVIRAGCGLDNIDLRYLQERGVDLVTVPQPGAQAVAEMAIALMFALARNLRQADQSLRKGHWIKNEIEGHLLAGKVLGIVGAGNIGSRVGRLGAALGMKPIGCVENPTPAVATELRQKGIQLASFQEVLTGADFLTLHVPLTPSTKNFINATTLALMKPGSYLINLARGGVVDEAALFQELVSNRIGGAALDVHLREGEGQISPLADLPNVLLTPHIGATTVETQQDIGRRIVQIVDAFAEPKSREHEVRFNSPGIPGGFQLPAMTD